MNKDKESNHANTMTGDIGRAHDMSSQGVCICCTNK